MSSKCDFCPPQSSTIDHKNILKCTAPDKTFTPITHKRDIALTYAYLMVEYDEI